MRASQQQQTPLRWVLWGLAALITLWLYSLWSTPAMGRELHALAEAGNDIEVLGIGRHSASVIFLQCVDRPLPSHPRHERASR